MKDKNKEAQLNISDLHNEEDIHAFHVQCHANIRENNEKLNQGLTYLIIGCISLIISVVFFVLSFKYNQLKQRIFRPNSFEFIVFCATALLAVSGIISGLIISIKAKKEITKNQKNIDGTPL